MALNSPNLVALLVLLAWLSGVRSSRLLRQTTESITSQGANQLASVYIVAAQAHEAESRVNSASKAGLFHNEATVVSVAGDAFPSARAMAATHNSEQDGGRAGAGGGYYSGGNVDAFGPVALAATQTGASAFSGSHAYPIALDGHLDHEASHAATSPLYDNFNLRPASGRTRVFTQSIGVTERAPTSSGISNAAGGPIAVAQAGEAVSIANADTRMNDRGIQ